MKPNNRGAVDLVAIGVLLLVSFLGVQFYKVIAPGRNSKKADQVAIAAVSTQLQTITVEQSARVVDIAVADVKAAHAVEIGTLNKMAANATGFSITAKEALKDDPSDAADVARMLIQYSVDSLGVELTALEQQKFIQMAAPLIAKNAKMRAELEQAHLDAVATASSLKAETDRRVEAEATAKEATTTLRAEAKKSVETAKVNVKLSNQNKAWADDAETLWDRIKAAGWLIGTLVVLGLFLAWKLLGSVKFGQDMVALQTHTEGLAVTAGHDANELAGKIKEWWQGDKNEAKATAVKTDVLRQ